MSEQLYQLLSLQIPEPEIREEGFLEITGQTHKENVNSQVYAFFLDLNRQRAVAELFRDALLHLIIEKGGKAIDLDEFDVQTEVGTDKGNRIDILLTDAGNESAIIIENKIYHTLQNDLEDYWNSTKVENENKSGVLLTLENKSVNDGNNKSGERFVNIEHIEWIKEIQRRGLPSGLPHKYYVYLNDFFNSIEQLTKDITMNEQAKFFFEHQQQVIKAKDTFSEAQKYIENQVAAVASELGWDTYGRNGRWVHMWPKGQKENVVFVIVFDSLTQPGDASPFFHIIIQLEKDACEYEQHIKDAVRSVGECVGLDFTTKERGGNWLHLAFKRYEPSSQELEGLTEYIVGEINRFLPTYERLVGELQHLVDDN